MTVLATKRGVAAGNCESNDNFVRGFGCFVFTMKLRQENSTCEDRKHIQPRHPAVASYTELSHDACPWGSPR